MTDDDRLRQAAEDIVRGYEQMNKLLPLAGGIPRPIKESDDSAVLLAVAYLAGPSLLAALEGLGYRDPDTGLMRYCDHPIEPCGRCELVRDALRKAKGE